MIWNISLFFGFYFWLFQSKTSSGPFQMSILIQGELLTGEAHACDGWKLSSAVCAFISWQQTASSVPCKWVRCSGTYSEFRFPDMATLPRMTCILFCFHDGFLFHCISTEICKHHIAKHFAAVSWAVRLGGMCQFCVWLSLVGALGSTIWICENLSLLTGFNLI